MLFQFLLNLSFFGYLIAILLDPFSNFSSSTDSLIGDHLNWEFDNFDTGLLNDKEYFGFVFRCEGILLGALLDTDDLGDHVRLIFGVVSLVPDEASFDKIVEFSIIQELDESFSGKCDLFD